jgi:hypothetical protein
MKRVINVYAVLALLIIGATDAVALNYVDTALLAGSKNYVKNGGAEQGRAGWTTYADAAGTTPVDCTGGSPVSTWTTSATTPLSGQYSFVWTHPASNRQGEGFAYTFTIDKADQGKQHTVSFDYEVASGTFTPGVVPIGGATAVDSDVEVFIYDTVNAQIIQPSNFRLLGSAGAQQRFSGTFQAASNSTVYRLCGHNATTTTNAFSLRPDNFRVSPALAPTAPIIGDTGAVAWAPTGSWVSNTTYTGWWRRDGDMGEYWVHIALAGAPTSTSLTINLPSGQTYDTSKMPNDPSYTPLGDGAASHSGVGQKLYLVQSGTSAVLAAFQSAASSTAATGSVVTQAAPVTFANADTLDFHWKAPIVGWSSGNASAQAGDENRMMGFEASTATATITGSNSDISWTKIRDDIGGFNGTTTWTASSPGWYYIDAAIRIDGTFSAGNDAEIVINVGGSDKYFALARAGGAQLSLFPHISKATYLNAGDAVKTRVASAGTSPVSGANTTYSWWTIAKWPGNAQLTAADTVGASYGYSGTASIGTGMSDFTTDTKYWDRTGSFNQSTGEWTCPIPGIYSWAANLTTGSFAQTAGNRLEVVLQKKPVGGSYSTYKSFPSSVFQASRTGIATFGGSANFDCKAGDLVKMSYDNSQTGASFSGSATQNFVEITRIGN